MNNENNNQKLTALANEFKATMNHAEEIFEQYLEAAIEQAVMEAFNELSDADKMILLLGLMTEAVEDAAKEDVKKESEDAAWSKEDFVKELARLRGESEKKVVMSNPPYDDLEDFAEVFAALWALRTNSIIHTLG